MLRDPIQRFISIYKHAVRAGWVKEDLPTWMRKYPRDNLQVEHLTGGQHIELAREMVLEKMRVVGLLERYDQSLLILRQRLGIANWNVAYGRAKNVGGQSDAFRDLPELIERHHDEIVERNSLDIRLYEFVRDEIWPTYVGDYGGKQKLEEDLRNAFAPSQERHRQSPGCLWRKAANWSYRNLVYRPLARLDCARKRKLHANAGQRSVPA